MVWLGVDEHFVARESTDQAPAGFLAAWRRALSSRGVPLAYTLRFINQMGRIILRMVFGAAALLYLTAALLAVWGLPKRNRSVEG